MDDQQIRITSIELAIKSNAGYSYKDGVTEISNNIAVAEKVLEDAQKFYNFINTTQ